MALVREVGLKLDGSVRNVAIDHDQQGNCYGTVQVENADGISDVSFNSHDTNAMGVASMATGTPVAWVVRPYVVYGASKRNGAPYGFLKLNFVRDQLATVGALD